MKTFLWLTRDENCCQLWFVAPRWDPQYKMWHKLKGTKKITPSRAIISEETATAFLSGDPLKIGDCYEFDVIKGRYTKWH